MTPRTFRQWTDALALASALTGKTGPCRADDVLARALKYWRRHAKYKLAKKGKDWRQVLKDAPRRKPPFQQAPFTGRQGSLPELRRYGPGGGPSP